MKQCAGQNVLSPHKDGLEDVVHGAFFDMLNKVLDPSSGPKLRAA